MRHQLLVLNRTVTMPTPLLPLGPFASGTRDVESFTSYLVRLAAAHGVTPRRMFCVSRCRPQLSTPTALTCLPQVSNRDGPIATSEFGYKLARIIAERTGMAEVVNLTWWRPENRCSVARLIAHVNAAVDGTRKAERRQANQADAEYLKESKWILLKNPANHTEKQAAQYQGLLKRNLASVKAHQMRLALQEIYLIADVTVARRKLRAWCRWVHWIAGKHLRPLFADMRNSADMITRHLDGILGHWVRGTTNAFLEGLNSVFSAVKRKARGFRSTENLITMLYFTAGRLDLPVTH